MASLLRQALATATVASTGVAMVMAGDAKAILTCTFGNLGACTGTVGNLKFSNFAATGSAQDKDRISISLSPTTGVYSISNNYTTTGDPAPLIGSGQMSFTVETLPGYFLNTASANSDTLSQATPDFKFTSTLSSLPSQLISTGGNAGPLAFNGGTTLSNVVINWAQGSSQNEAYGSSLRLTTNPPSLPVPGPLPILGAGTMFGLSRRLRRRAISAANG